MTVRRFGLLLFATLVVVLSASAQLPTAALRGTVMDPTGAVVPGASVTVENTATGVAERQTTTDDAGRFAVEALPPGRYRITLEKSGFGTVTQTIELQVGRVTSLNLTLAVQAVEQQVTVSAAPPLVDRENSSLTEVVEPRQIAALPLNGRQFADLASLVPGVLPAPNFDPIKTRVFNVSAGGSDGRSSNFSIDGGEDTDIVNGGLLQNFTVEGIQEFAVTSSRYGADQGRALGAAVNVITKSGSNDFHGSYFLFARTDELNARDPFQAEKANFHRVQQGFTVGGPVAKNKTFFFVAYENVDENNLGIVNTNGAFPSFEGSFDLPYKNHLLTTRVDHELTDRQKLTFRYALENNSSREGIGGIRSEENGIRSTNRGDSFVGKHVFVLSPRAVNTFTYHFGRFDNHLLPLSNTPEVDRPSLISGGAFNTPQNTLIYRNQIRDDVALNIPGPWGSHNLKFGFDYTRIKVDAGLEFASRGQFIFFTDTPLTETMADLAFFAVGDFQFPSYHDNIIGLYAQDDWHVSPRLTFNLGVRWDASTQENNPGFTSPIAPPGARKRDLNNLGPRLGFAFDPVGNGKTVVRGGYGIFYALPIATGPAVESAFDGQRIGFGLFFGPIDVVDPFPGLTPDQVAALVFAQPQFLLLTLDNNLSTPYVQQSSIGIQQTIASDWAVTLDFVHNLGVKERLGRDINIDPFGNIGSPDTMLAQEFGDTVAASLGPVIRVDDSGRSSYNALEASLEKRFSHNYQLLLSYTYSHAIDMGDDSIGSTAADPFDLTQERGDSNRDQRHRFVLSGLIELPYDFRLSTITSFATPRPYDIVTGESLDGFAPARPPGITRNQGARGDRPGTIQAINDLRALAALPPISSTEPQSFFFYSTDLRLDKRFALGEHASILVGMEAFNIFNHVNFLSNGGATFSGVSGAQNNVFAPDFGFPRRTAGGVLGSGGPRAGQIMVRFEF